MKRYEEIRVHGIVQGVGFRPFVYRLARDERLDGNVRNEGGVVMIKVAGPGERIEAFVAALRAAPPPLARIDRIERMTVAGGQPQGFSIGLSLSGDIVGGEPAISPDTAVCQTAWRIFLNLAIGISAIHSPTAPTVARVCRSYTQFHTTGTTPVWWISQCARPARANTTTPTTVGSTHNPTHVQPAVRRRD